MPIQRLIRLSDIIFAASITILALVFDPPSAQMSSAKVTEFLVQKLPDLGVYIISFITITFYWFTHVHQFKHYQKTDSIHLFLSILALMFVPVLPYACDLSEYYDGVFAVQAFYSIVAAGVGIFSSAAWIYGTQNRRLVEPDLSDEIIREIRQESYIEPIISLVAIAGAWLAPWGWTATFLVGFPVAFLIKSLDGRSTE